MFEPQRSPAVDLSTAQLALGFHALADPLRLQVLALLSCEELCVCDLTERLGIAQSKLSFHLKTLKAAGLVCTQQVKRWTYYRLNQPAIATLEEHLARYRACPLTTPARLCEEPVGRQMQI